MKPHNVLLVLLGITAHIPYGLLSNNDFYNILGIKKNADSLEIRRAFKRLAVLKHPDKNPNDSEAQENFVKLSEAYHVLKDPARRSEYDLYGKKSFEGQPTPSYHSYSYYRDQFGIYDDDPLIVTLSRHDIESSLEDTVWFINLYSPGCSGCHHLAPEWRKLAKALEGVVKIGAVNCDDERQLCWDLQVRHYPYLLYFSEGSGMHSGVEYRRAKTAEEMEKFCMELISVYHYMPAMGGPPDPTRAPWLLFLCSPDDPFCPSDNTKFKVTIALKGLVNVGRSEDPKIIEKISGNVKSKILFWDKKEHEDPRTEILYGDEYQDITEDVLNLLPEAQKMDQEGFQQARTRLRDGTEDPWLLCFTVGLDTQKTIMLKKLTAMLDNFQVAEVNCGKSSGLCASLHVSKYPSWAVLKRSGAFEMHAGKTRLHDLQMFAVESLTSANLHSLSPQDLQRIMTEGTPWMIGWLLASCPPCKKMLPALRKASSHFTPDVIQFGTVDCALHSHVCSRYNIHSYPTAAIYNSTNVITFRGEADEKAIVDFIRMMGIEIQILTMANFKQEVGAKTESEIYVVEFYAPWCAPCQRLQPDWHKMAHKLSHLKFVKVGAVNCEQEKELCTLQMIKSYPTIRLYPMGSTGFNTVAMYSNPNRDAASLHKWVLDFIPSSVKELNTDNYEINLMSKLEDRMWVVMYMAPWCGYCHMFEPEFITVIQRLDNVVVGGKVDCQREGSLCHREGITSYPTVKVFQRVDGVTKLTGGITIEGYTQEALYTEVKNLAANAYITPVHEEL